MQRIRNSSVRKRTLYLIEEGIKPRIVQLYGTHRNPARTSHTDPKEHVTVRLATADRATIGKAQTVHTYYDNKGTYAGDALYQGRERRKMASRVRLSICNYEEMRASGA
ncbi:hypothetical protein K469DRAFT_679261 [Zopfia rhizophila CBS 207.26]|uniref:Uncharacterized protein n=1 Tax=Zopfia rhizophila CBS 207.26 TaxID=1314779 RepID=A0A6A6D914_9PEZI|nr:hypothetical protein K469DRAFT_679261 [Zopfia rhizophila CBS 207.26]